MPAVWQAAEKVSTTCGPFVPLARINVFERSRRIALVLKVVWLIGVAIVAAVLLPSASLTFITLRPHEPLILTGETCDGRDAVEFVKPSTMVGRARWTVFQVARLRVEPAASGSLQDRQRDDVRH
jgi:hypothetical protein